MQSNDAPYESRGETRRTFLKRAAGLALAATSAQYLAGCATASKPEPIRSTKGTPWYRRTYRWGQTNITEIDPTCYDIGWWRQYWKRTETQGVIINAGGIFAFYPSRFPLQHQPECLGGRDLYGELTKAAREEGLAVLARMDSNRAHEPFYSAHPDWFAIDAAGKPYRAGDLYITCINSPYYDEYIPDVLREIIDRSHPDGITDNSWSGLDRNSICYCSNCARRFRAVTSQELPRQKNWHDPAYRKWIQWNYARRLEIWDLNNRVTKAAGGSECLWIGMNSGSITGQSRSFRDYKEICQRAEIIMLDDQARNDAEGFQHNGEAGKLIHGLLGWDKLIPESMAMYQAGRPTFRLASKPAPEARMWMIEGIAGGLQPWWHHVGAYHEDRRMYHTAEPVVRWHAANEEFLVNRQPIATVGVVWSQQNTDFYGQDNSDELVDLPFRGITNALLRARIPHLPVHIDHVDRDASQFKLLILPDVAAMSESQCASIRRFVQNGGSLIATGQTSLCDEWGDARHDFGLADLFGAHTAKTEEPARRKGESVHTYLRLVPELRAQVDGPHTPDEPKEHGLRHCVLRGFEETDILPFGGRLSPLKLDSDAQVLMTFVPEFPVYPPETSWMREPRTTIPGLIVRTCAGGGRVAFVPADLDRRYGRDNLPDHGNLLANLVRWTANDQIPLSIAGPGLLDCHLYKQATRLLIHMVNLSNAGTWRAPLDELLPIGPLQVNVQLPASVAAHELRLAVSGEHQPLKIRNGWASFRISSVLDHELAIIS